MVGQGYGILKEEQLDASFCYFQTNNTYRVRMIIAPHSQHLWKIPEMFKLKICTKVTCMEDTGF